MNPATIILPDPDDIAVKSLSDHIINIGPEPKQSIMHAKRNIFLNWELFIEIVLL